jgi:hypothetical protein
LFNPKALFRCEARLYPGIHLACNLDVVMCAQTAPDDTRKCIKRWCNQFKVTDSAEERKSTGRPGSQETVNRIREKIAGSRRTSVNVYTFTELGRVVLQKIFNMGTGPEGRRK